eukprot:PhM_4_TR12503/c0_g1_i1/m.65046
MNDDDFFADLFRPPTSATATPPAAAAATPAVPTTNTCTTPPPVGMKIRPTKDHVRQYLQQQMQNNNNNNNNINVSSIAHDIADSYCAALLCEQDTDDDSVVKAARRNMAMEEQIASLRSDADDLRGALSLRSTSLQQLLSPFRAAENNNNNNN